MQINVSFDQSASSLPTGFVAAINYVVNYFDSLFTNNVTISIDVGYGEIAGQTLGSNALGESKSNLSRNQLQLATKCFASPGRAGCLHSALKLTVVGQSKYDASRSAGVRAVFKQ